MSGAVRFGRTMLKFALQLAAVFLLMLLANKLISGDLRFDDVAGWWPIIRNDVGIALLLGVLVSAAIAVVIWLWSAVLRQHFKARPR